MSQSSTRQDILSQSQGLFSQFLKTWNYLPVTSWDHFFNPQVFISSNSGDAGVENAVLSEVGSYGRQLGILMDAVQVLTAKLDPAGLLPADQKALTRLDDLAQQVDAVTSAHKTAPSTELTSAGVADFVDKLTTLAKSDPAKAKLIAGQVQAAL
jgi:hypothetical protein